MENITANDVVASIIQGMADWEVIPVDPDSGIPIVKVFVDEDEIARVFVEGDTVSLFIAPLTDEEVELSLSDPHFDTRLAEALITAFTNYMKRGEGKAYNNPLWGKYIDKLKEYISRG